jgi:3-carboxy-cis,cis-muconate cycloisomerase
VLAQRLEMLLRLYGDPEVAELLSEETTIGGWLRVEAALARAQGELGLLDPDDAAAIVAATDTLKIDSDRLWAETRTVGYPILPLIRQLDESLPAERRGRVHYGATTQDVMDSGLALQLDRAGRRLGTLLARFGDAMAELAEEHADTVLAGRTHAMHAVPTTFGAKLASYLGELARHRERLDAARRRVAVVSLFGAGGTSAAYGPTAPVLRARVAELLGLAGTDVPWHVARDGLAEFGLLCAQLSATCARFAREVVDLSRTEIGEIGEAAGHHRGASSTMPQKVNPIESEAVIGLAATAGALSSALLRAMEAGHERAAGEWQIEWQALPELVSLSAAALATSGSIASGLQVFPDAMRANLGADGGMVMAEAYMMRLAGTLGRERAHDLVYRAVSRCRRTGETLAEVLRAELSGQPAAGEIEELTPESWVGRPGHTVHAALTVWRDRHATPAGHGVPRDTPASG